MRSSGHLSEASQNAKDEERFADTLLDIVEDCSILAIVAENSKCEPSRLHGIISYLLIHAEEY